MFTEGIKFLPVNVFPQTSVNFSSSPSKLKHIAQFMHKYAIFKENVFNYFAFNSVVSELQCDWQITIDQFTTTTILPSFYNYFYNSFWWTKTEAETLITINTKHLTLQLFKNIKIQYLILTHPRSNLQHLLIISVSITDNPI